jgi:serine/threonine protein kinase
VIRRPDGTFAFVDFGAVRDRLREEGGSTVVGTFGYMAPEQFQGRALPQSDVYAVGATVLSMLAGEEPEKLPHTGLKIDVAAALGKRASPTLVSILSRMLEPDPETRPASIAPLLGGFDVHSETAREARAPKAVPASSTAHGASDPPVPPSALSFFRILRRFLPFFWVMSALAWWWLPWSIAMSFCVGLAILSLATNEFAPKQVQRTRLKRIAPYPSVRIAEPEEAVLKRRVGHEKPVPLASDLGEEREDARRKV